MTDHPDTEPRQVDEPWRHYTRALEAAASGDAAPAVTSSDGRDATEPDDAELLDAYSAAVTQAVQMRPGNDVAPSHWKRRGSASTLAWPIIA